MSGIGESRSELLLWVNNLLNLKIAKIEECGTGAIYCQILDSIYGDIPMHRVKFGFHIPEYEMYTNYKILQNCFNRHSIEKPVIVEKLVRCKFQDNLEFLQWLKKFWVVNKDFETEYDATARRSSSTINNTNGNGNGRSSRVSSTGVRRSSVGIVSKSISASGMNNQYINDNGNNTTRKPSLGSITHNNVSLGVNKRPIRNFGTAANGISNNTTALYETKIENLANELNQQKMKVDLLNKEMQQFQEAMNVMERERDFYFGKLRDVEILSTTTEQLLKEEYQLNNTNNEGVDLSIKDQVFEQFSSFVNKIQTILYATEDGFESVLPEEDKDIIKTNNNADNIAKEENAINDTNENAGPNSDIIAGSNNINTIITNEETF
ncbi:related to Protein BIM1 [Saccharomycodes ludwigii]|uniref:Related to Protein BIM1 n=1 Tax=Saccharomycodes ludwigii TaxID=36035 RepID=A0A376B8W4_9ASCO|nr:hypothetical protein SCDLUD_005198 [Saccharomycodes ludwigii]KAH3898859.1 hypothetical protein SCDLUD_005198 [Saccharomycodes ludwigii]SSD61097.1 related to Protein BIM1 [Saccharomycodes ludwigii]